MPYSNLKIELINTGDQNNTWGTTTNLNLGTALEEAIVGRASVVIANPPASPIAATLTLVDSPSSQTARNFILNVTSAGTLASTQTIEVPAINKPYIVENVRNPNLMQKIIQEFNGYIYTVGSHTYFTNVFFAPNTVYQEKYIIQNISKKKREGGKNVNTVFELFITTVENLKQ
jgi:hypothetical protein